MRGGVFGFVCFVLFFTSSSSFAALLTKAEDLVQYAQILAIAVFSCTVAIVMLDYCCSSFAFLLLLRRALLR